MNRVVEQVRALHRLEPADNDSAAAVRVAVSVALPSLLLLAAGRTDLIIYAVFGGLTAMYGRSAPHQLRLRHQGQAAGMLLGGVAVGVVLSANHLQSWWLVAVEATLAGAGSVYADRMRLKPAGPFFGILALGACASVPAAVPWFVALLIAAGSAALSLPWARPAGWPRQAGTRTSPEPAARGPGRAPRTPDPRRPLHAGGGCRRYRGGHQRQRPSALGHGGCRCAAGRRRPAQQRPPRHPPDRGDVRGPGRHRRRDPSRPVVACRAGSGQRGGGAGPAGDRVPVRDRAVHDPPLRAGDGLVHPGDPVDDAARRPRGSHRADRGTGGGNPGGGAGGDRGGGGGPAAGDPLPALRYWALRAGPAISLAGANLASTATALYRLDGTDTALPRWLSASPSRTTLSASSHAQAGATDLSIPIRWWNSVWVRPGHTAVTLMPAGTVSEVGPPAEAEQPRLGRRVGAARQERGDAGHVDDPAAATGQHALQRGVGQHHRRFSVEFQVPLLLADGVVLEVVQQPGPGVVHQDAHRPVRERTGVRRRRPPRRRPSGLRGVPQRWSRTAVPARPRPLPAGHGSGPPAPGCSPAAASCRANSAPRPELAPVIRAVVPRAGWLIRPA